MLQPKEVQLVLVQKSEGLQLIQQLSCKIHKNFMVENNLLSIANTIYDGEENGSYFTVKIAQYIPLKSWPLIFLLTEETREAK